MRAKQLKQGLAASLWEDLSPIELVQAIDESLLSMVLLLRYEQGHLEETLNHYENLHQMRKVILSQISLSHGN